MADFNNSRVRKVRIVEWIAEVHSLTKNKPGEPYYIMSKDNTEDTDHKQWVSKISKALNPAAPSFVPLNTLNPAAPEFDPSIRGDGQETGVTNSKTPEPSIAHHYQDVPEWPLQPETGHQQQYRRSHGRGYKRTNRKRSWEALTAQPNTTIPATQYLDFNDTLVYGFDFGSYAGQQYVPRSANVSPRTILPTLSYAQPPFAIYEKGATTESSQYDTPAPFFDQMHARPFHVHDTDTNRLSRWATISELADNALAAAGLEPAICTPTANVPFLSSLPIVSGALQADRDLYNLTGYPIDRAVLRMHVTNLGIDMKRDHTSRGLRDRSKMSEFEVGYAQRVIQFDTMPAPDLEEVVRKIAEE
jgi:hypothetical protein